MLTACCCPSPAARILGSSRSTKAAALVQEAAHVDANIIFGATIDDALGDEVRVTVIAAGFDGGMPKRRTDGSTLRRHVPKSPSPVEETRVAAPRVIEGEDPLSGDYEREPARVGMPLVDDDLDAPDFRSEFADAGGLRHADHRRTISGDFIGVLFTDRTLDVADRAEPGTRNRFDRSASSDRWPAGHVDAPGPWSPGGGDRPSAGRRADSRRARDRGHFSALGARAADCVPVLLADLVSGAVAAVHAETRSRGQRCGRRPRCARRPRWAPPAPNALSPGSARTSADRATRCPTRSAPRLRDLVPLTHAVTSWGTPALDLGAGVTAQLTERGVAEVISVGGCTMEEPRLHSHRRDATAAGPSGRSRMASPRTTAAGVEPRDLGKPRFGKG